MALPIGSRLGPYQVTAQLGSGGMGEVYRAIDTNLKRSVAIKVLPESFANDADRLARFEREAQTLASLNHPNIAAIHGFEQSHDLRALVMELVEGEDLSQHIARGAIPLDEALSIARQIAQALEAAHEQGIIHRDLKPANIKVRSDGTVKVLDFGLAKMMAGTAPTTLNVASSSATVTSPPMTEVGLILGTAPYMAPEQARGKSVDRRVDIWAFGCVLYEMLTGMRPFTGDTVTDLVAAVVSREPDWTLLSTRTPPAILNLLHRCLEKDPLRRLRDIGEARVVLEEPQARGQPIALPSSSRRWVIPSLVVALALLATSTAVLLLNNWRFGAAALPPVTRFDVQPPGASALTLDFRPAIAVSTDGSVIAFGAATEGVNRIYVRSRNDVSIRVVPGSEGGGGPTLSPDGKWVVFFANGAVRKAAIDGPAVELGPARDVRGITWSDNGSLFFPPDAAGPLVQMTPEGGEQRPITELRAGERTHRWPDALPGGNAVLFTVGTLASPDSYEAADVEAVLVSTKERRTVIREAAMARYCGSGRLVYAKGSSLFAVPFDPDRLTTTGAPVQIVAGVERDVSTGAAHFDCAADGTLLFVPGSPSGPLRQLVWADRDGVRQPIPLAPGTYQEVRVSPDGRRAVLLEGASGKGDVWTYDFDAGTFSRLTFTRVNAAPMWSPDGKAVYYSAFDAATAQTAIMRKAADGSRDAEVARTISGRAYLGWIDDRETLAIVDAVNAASDRGDVMRVALRSTVPPERIVATSANEFATSVSPGGRWLAYESDESGRLAVYVRDLTGSGGRWQVTPTGGEEPHWSADGRELYYRTANRLMVVQVNQRVSFQAGNPRLLFDSIYTTGIESGRSYDVDPRTGRFLLVTPVNAGAAAGVVRVVLNWDSAFTPLGQ